MEKHLDRALAEAKLAYQFSPGSYAASALCECIRALNYARERPDWILEFTEYMPAAAT
jgi:hypothetical protein